MYVIIVYDFDESRVSKVNRILKSYLIWTQNSVFEGNITESLLEELKWKVKKIMEGSDSFVIYKLRSSSLAIKEVYGPTKDPNVI